MKIFHKINLLIIISVLALVLLAVFSAVFRAQELKYYSLVETVKNLQNHVLSAVIHERNFGRTYSGEKSVHSSIKKAKEELRQIDRAFLPSASTQIDRISSLLHEFEEVFKKMTTGGGKNYSVALEKRIQFIEEKVEKCLQ